MACFQCEMDIPHICYEGIPNARWRLGDEAIAALEAANRENLQRLTREIRKQEIRKVPSVRSEEPAKPTLPEARAKTRTPKAPS